LDRCLSQGEPRDATVNIDISNFSTTSRGFSATAFLYTSATVQMLKFGPDRRCWGQSRQVP